MLEAALAVRAKDYGFELMRLCNMHGRIDPSYSSAMTLAVANYLVHRYGNVSIKPSRSTALPTWRTRQISDFVQENLSTVTIDDLAVLTKLSVGHLHRSFRATFGMTPLAYINQCRIERARSILATSNVPIIQVSLDIGFASPSHFASLFKRQTGVTPMEYRTHKRS